MAGKCLLEVYLQTGLTGGDIFLGGNALAVCLHHNAESAEAVESDTVRVLEVSSHHTNQVVDGVLHIARSERAILRNLSFTVD